MRKAKQKKHPDYYSDLQKLDFLIVIIALVFFFSKFQVELSHLLKFTSYSILSII